MATQGIVESAIREALDAVYPGIRMENIRLLPAGLSISRLAWDDPVKSGVGFTVEQADVRISLAGIVSAFRYRDARRLFSLIELEKPRLELRRSAEGFWQLPLPLTMKRKLTSAWPAFEVRSRNGRLLIKDSFAVAAGRESMFALEGVSLTGRARRGSFSFDMKSSSDHASSITARGWFSTEKPLFDLRLTVENGDPDIWAPYVFGRSLKAENGKFSLQTVISGTPQQKGSYLDYAGSVSLSDVDIAFPGRGINLKRLTGPVSFETGLIRASGTRLHFEGMPLQVSGELRDFRCPTLEARVEVRNLLLPQAKVLHKYFGESAIAGKAAAAMRLYGPLDNLTAEGMADLTGLAFGKERIGGVKARYRYAAGVLRIPAFEARELGLKGSLLIDLRQREPHGAAILEGSSVHPGALPAVGHIFKDIDAPAGISGRALLSFRGRRLEKAGIVSQGRDITVKGRRFGNMAASLQYDNGGWVVRSLLASLGGRSELSLQGSISREGSLALYLEGNGLPVPPLSAGMPFSFPQGIALSGRICGSLGNPRFEGLAGGSKAVMGSVVCDGFSGRIIFDWQKKALGMNSLIARAMDTRIRLTGEVSPGGIDLQGDTERIDLALLAGILKKDNRPPVRGRAVVSFHAEGTLKDPRWRFSAVSDKLSWAGRNFAGMKADLSWGSGCCRIDNLLLRTGESEVQASGSISEENYDMQFEGKGVNMALLRSFIGALPDWNGVLDIRGRIAGSLKETAMLSGQVAVEAASLFAADTDFGSLSGRADISKGRADWSAIISRNSKAVFTARGRQPINGGPADMQLSAENLPIDLLKTVLPRTAGKLPLSGAAINGQAKITGYHSSVRPGTIDLDLRIDNGSLLQRRIEQATLRASVIAGMADIKRLKISGPEVGHISIEGSSGLYGEHSGHPLDLHFEMTNTDMTSVMLSRKEIVTGRISLAGTLSGTWDNPRVDGEFTATQGTLMGYGFTSLKGSALANGEGVLLKDVSVSRDGHQAVISGSLPVDCRTFRLHKDRPMDLEARLVRGDLSLLAVFLPGLSDAAGGVEAVLHVGGTPGVPQIFGRAVVNEGHAMLSGLGRIKDMQAILSFQGRSMDIEAAAFKMGSGLVSGGGRIYFSHEDVGKSMFSFKSSGAEISMPWLTGRLDGELQLSGSGSGSMLEGSLTLKGATFYLREGEKKPFPAFVADPALRLDVRLEEGTRVVGNNVKAVGGGSLAVSGKCSDPVIKGEVISRQGEIDISTFSAPFRLLNAKALFDDKKGSKPLIASAPRIAVELQGRAVSRVGKTEIFMDVAGRLPDLKIDLSTRANMADDEILALLTRVESLEAMIGGRMEDVVKEELIRLVSGSIRSQLFEPIERSLAGALGLNEFAFEYDEESVSIRVAKHIIDGLYLSYITTIFSNEQHNVMQADYYLKNDIVLSWSADDLGEGRGEVRWQYRF